MKASDVKTNDIPGHSLGIGIFRCKMSFKYGEIFFYRQRKCSLQMEKESVMNEMCPL